MGVFKTKILICTLSLLLLFGCTNTNSANKKCSPLSMGSPLPDGYMYDLCRKHNSNWICDNNMVNNIDCCKCNNLNETFYFETGCSNLSPKDICTNSGGNWTVDTNSRPNLKKCLCPPEYSFNPKWGCFK